VDPAVGGALERAVSVFDELGCRVELACPDLRGADQVFRTMRAMQFEVSYGALLAEHPDGVKDSLRDNIELGRRLTGPNIGRAEAARAVIHQRVREFFDEYDVLLAPVSQVPPFPIDVEYPIEVAGQAMADYIEWMASSYLISVTGCPALSVPAGFTAEGLPVGLQIVGPHRADLATLRVGHAFEQATRHGERRPPLVGAG
jgi:amidase